MVACSPNSYVGQPVPPWPWCCPPGAPTSNVLLSDQGAVVGQDHSCSCALPACADQAANVPQSLGFIKLPFQFVCSLQ